MLILFERKEVHVIIANVLHRILLNKAFFEKFYEIIRHDVSLLLLLFILFIFLIFRIALLDLVYLSLRWWLLFFFTRRWFWYINGLINVYGLGYLISILHSSFIWAFRSGQLAVAILFLLPYSLLLNFIIGGPHVLNAHTCLFESISKRFGQRLLFLLNHNFLLREHLYIKYGQPFPNLVPDL